MNYQIVKAEIYDAEEILKLQKLAINMNVAI